MRLPGRGNKNQLPIDVRKVLMAALASAMDDGRQQQPAKEGRKGLTGVRALAAGAVLATAGRVAFKNRDAIRERLQGDHDEPVDEEDYDDEEYEDEPEGEYEDEPEGEAEEDFEEEPEAEEDEEPEARADEDEDEQPEAEEDEEPAAEGEDEPEAEEDEEPEAQDDEQPEAQADEDADDDSENDEGPDSDARPSNIDEGRPPIFDRPLGRRKRSRPSTRPPKHSDGEPVLQPPPRPSRSRAPVGRT